ncbi:alcohol dehydrogenase [Desulfobaculum xiamenense]|uniref:Alcohol dehydrogenase n=1 Tax=Desulfobaculum xiamenense TaxID=995050 RepID=A0A846QR77_9BACT|nr:iron-containing alcohol dehydrogenase [Desulfobaculum xiamenense]NJB67704.1 alcohol dehydrogenase [Desulfobaculum xiamenense]
MLTIPEVLVVPAETRSGLGVAHSVALHASRFGARGVLVHGASLRRSGVLGHILDATPTNITCLPWEHPGGEPTLDALDALLAFARENHAEWIAAVGGGSVLDIAKACAGLHALPMPSVQYHDGAPVDGPGLPFIAVPTTAGTGSEATPVAVLTNTQTGVKKSFRSRSMTASLVLLDPSLLESCPASVVASSGLDAVTQAVESYTSRFATWHSQALALRGLELLCTNLAPAYRGARDAGHVAPAHAEGILTGSYLAGLGFASSRLGVVHGLAHPLGARYHQPHGLTCGVCLPLAVELNREAMGERYDEMSRAIGTDLLDAIHAMLDEFDIGNPFSGQPLPDRAAVIEETLVSGSTKANPLTITAEHVTLLLDRLFA